MFRREEKEGIKVTLFLRLRDASSACAQFGSVRTHSLSQSVSSVYAQNAYCIYGGKKKLRPGKKGGGGGRDLATPSFDYTPNQTKTYFCHENYNTIVHQATVDAMIMLVLYKTHILVNKVRIFVWWGL